MNVPDTTRHELIIAKVNKLIDQCRILAVEEFPYSDSQAALGALRAQSERLRHQASDFSSWSDGMQKHFSLQVNYKLESISWILGIIARSNSMRNSFELYSNFKDICKKLIDQDVHLILSSEWNYTPFTYPMNLQELPEFIIIGLPAPESNNVLVFPVAGHEVGHSIWLKGELTEKYSPYVYQEVSNFSQRSSSSILSIFPKSGDKNQDDLFSKQMTEQFISDATSSCLRQLEEVFCDFVGLRIFGEGYLQAFRYLIAPGGGGRSLEYPPIKERARLLDRYGDHLGFKVPGYVDEFMDGHDSRSNPYEVLVLRAADAVRDKFVDEMYSCAERRVGEAGIATPLEEEAKLSLQYFSEGMPTDKVEATGSLITAAWRLYLDESRRHLLKGNQSAIGYVSDLVLKSVESSEFKMEMKRAKR